MNSVRYLIFDADDTLWDNNSIYLATSGRFIELALKAGLSKARIEMDFEHLEIKVVKERGYGSENFIYILEYLFKDYNKISQIQNYIEEFQKILDDFKQRISKQPVLFPDVTSTLAKLICKYELYVLTKGDTEEQKNKLKSSDLTPFFKDTFVETEKNLHTYKRIIDLKKWEPQTVCMIGNSPKSDINPSLQTGMYAIFIPYAHTWKLENESLREHPRLTVLHQFSDLITLLL